MKTGKIVLWIVVAVFALIAVSSFSDSSDPNTRSFQALGSVIGTVFGVAAAGLGVALLLWRRKTAVPPPMPDDPNVAARPAPFWKIALGATAVALVAGIWAILAYLFFNNSSGDSWSILVVPLLMLLAGGFFFGHFSRRRPWLVSLFLIVPNPVFLSVFGAWLDGRGASKGYGGGISGSTLILLGAFVAAPLIGVGLARFRPPGPLDSGKLMKAAIIGVIICAVITAPTLLLMLLLMLAGIAAPVVLAWAVILTCSRSKRRLGILVLCSGLAGALLGAIGNSLLGEGGPSIGAWYFPIGAPFTFFAVCSFAYWHFRSKRRP